MATQEHLLVIRLSAMGDVAMTVPVLKSFVAQYPDVKITVVSKPFLKPLFEEIDNVQFFAADVKNRHKGIRGLFQLYKDTKKLGITKVADLHNVLRSKIVRNFYKFSGYQIAFIDKGRVEKKALTREVNKEFKQLKTTFERYSDVFASLGYQITQQEIQFKTRTLSDKALQLVGDKNTPWIGIAPFAAFEGKTYPITLMKEVIKDLSSNKLQLLLFGGGDKEITILNSLESEFDNVISVAGKLSFKEELALISNLDTMLAMDSGNAHLAAIQGINTITLWGVTHPYAGFAPYQQPSENCMLPDMIKYPKIPCSIYGNKVFDGYENVMETITPSSVVEKVLISIQP